MDMDNANESVFDNWSKTITDTSTLCPANSDDYLGLITPPSSTLTRLCCAQVSRHAKYIINYHTRLPGNVYPILLMEAIREDLYDSATFFISTWPSKVISMIDVIPYNVAIFAQSIAFNIDKNCYYKALKAMFCFLQLCLDVMKSRLTPCLRVFDFRGWVLNDPMTSFFVGEIISLWNEIHTLHDCNINHIVFECKIVKSQTIEELSNLLDMTRESRKNKIQLHIPKLDLCSLKEDKMKKLLELINPAKLIGLSISYSSMDFLTWIFTTFSSLTALQIEKANRIPRNQKLPFHLLPRLRRLRLSTYRNGLSTCVPISTLGQLEYLNMKEYSKNYVLVDDVRYMTSGPLYLRELNLSDRKVVTANLHLWRGLFLSLAPTLMILILEHCIRDKNHFAPMVSYIVPLGNLVFLDLVDCTISMKSMYDNVPKLGLMPQLKQIALPCPYYGYIDLVTGKKKSKKLRCEIIEQRVASLKSIPVKIQWFD